MFQCHPLGVNEQQYDFSGSETNRTAYLQLRNTSENQSVVLTDLAAKLTTKGYQLVKDPEQANYWIQVKIIYCHRAVEGVTPESVAKANFGAGISSGGTAMVSGGGMDEMMPGMAGMMRMGAMPDVNALMAQAVAMSGGRGGFPGMLPPPKEEGVTYLCVTDVQITDRRLGKLLGQPAAQTPTGSKVQHMRMVGHVRQKDLDIPEATPHHSGED
jgi:Enterobacterial TraT complement resistance protein